MSKLVIRVEGLSKRYRIGKRKEIANRQDSIYHNLTSPFQYLIDSLRPPSEDEILWALRDVTFDVFKGEVIGIIGRNGAGKSTLLKLLSRITEPTRGSALLLGRVGSLLEVGTGFHPELTGRENIYLSGAVLGMKRAEIDRKFDEIVAFAETEKFLDTPVKRYSSGMYVRLAFAVAAHLDPEILVVDEVLAVGDAAFQKKCLGKMGDVATQGRTVLFVSHNMVAIQNLCDRVIWLQNGGIMEHGPTPQVISHYLQVSLSNVTEQRWDDIMNAPGNDKVRLHRVSMRPINPDGSNLITMKSPLELVVEYWNMIPDSLLHLSLHFYNEQQIIAFTTTSIDSQHDAQDHPLQKGLFRSVCQIPGNFLNTGLHRVHLLILRNSKIVHRQEDAIVFDVLDMSTRSSTYYGKEPGAVRPILNWTTDLIPEQATV